MPQDRRSPRDSVVARRRRSWSAEQKRAIVAEIDVGGASLSEVARRHGVHANVLFRWRRDLGSVAGAPGDASTATTASAKAGFVPVMLPSTRASVPPRPGTIEIVLDGGRTVRVGTDVDTGALVRIIDALEARR